MYKKSLKFFKDFEVFWDFKKFFEISKTLSDSWTCEILNVFKMFKDLQDWQTLNDFERLVYEIVKELPTELSESMRHLIW